MQGVHGVWKRRDRQDSKSFILQSNVIWHVVWLKPWAKEGSTCLQPPCSLLPEPDRMEDGLDLCPQ